MNVPANLKYSNDHEWCRIEGDTAVIGITDFAQSQLGDIVFVDVPTVGETLAAGEVFGSIEAVKTVSDAFLPVGGEIVEFNDAVDADPAIVNKDAYGEGWIVKVKMSDPAEYDALLSAAAREANVPFADSIVMGATGTDARTLQLQQGGVPTGLLELPLRYMHTSVETGNLDTLHGCARILAECIASLGDGWEDAVCWKD